ncbi:small leucine-rich protein 1-like isoform X2 [Triplophysa rosa]|uniref:small leucine-rich protein 1-like isoform X2 n=1 Tax=Triplophysa rosa TaxID=992332 RepID=UPI002545C64F|nr:small leucine-rich protein 1-like isoform X2 [Triplophysa rosa]
MSTLAVFINHLPGWILWTGIFLPVTTLLLLIITALVYKLQQVEKELAVARDPRVTASQLCHGRRYRTRRTAGHMSAGLTLSDGYKTRTSD